MGESIRYAISMWRNTRMIVIAAMCGAIYAATLLAFKTAIPLIPGITEVRVANVFPMPFAFLFGPSAAWGLAIGNLIGDIFGGTLGPGSIAGFFGNFLLGYIPYSIWMSLYPFSPKEYTWNKRSRTHWINFMLVNFISSAACAIVIATFLDFLGFVPYTVLSKIIVINDFIGGIAGAFVLIAIYEAVRGQLGLFWVDVMGLEMRGRSNFKTIVSYILLLSCLFGIFGPYVLPISPFYSGLISSSVIVISIFLL